MADLPGKRESDPRRVQIRSLRRTLLPGGLLSAVVKDVSDGEIPRSSMSQHVCAVGDSPGMNGPTLRASTPVSTAQLDYACATCFCPITVRIEGTHVGVGLSRARWCRGVGEVELLDLAVILGFLELRLLLRRSAAFMGSCDTFK